MPVERGKSYLEQLGTVVEMLAAGTSKRFHGQRLLYPHPEEGLREILILAGTHHTRYYTRNLLAVFEDQADGYLTIVGHDTAVSEVIFKRLDDPNQHITLFRELGGQPLPSNPNPVPILFQDQRVYSLTGFRRVIGIGVHWEDPNKPALIIGAHNEVSGDILETNGYPS